MVVKLLALRNTELIRLLHEELAHEQYLTL